MACGVNWARTILRRRRWFGSSSVIMLFTRGFRRLGKGGKGEIGGGLTQSLASVTADARMLQNLLAIFKAPKGHELEGSDARWRDGVSSPGPVVELFRSVNESL